MHVVWMHIKLITEPFFRRKDSEPHVAPLRYAPQGERQGSRRGARFSSKVRIKFITD